MLMLYTDPWKQRCHGGALWIHLVGSREIYVFLSRSRNRISEPSSGLPKGRVSSFPPYGGRESKCHFPLRLWIITFMLWDRFASLKWKTISCLDETFPWMLSINWALKLLTRNSGLSCLKTQSGSWKHCRFFDLQKLASSMWLLTALFDIQGKPSKIFLVCLSFSLSALFHCLSLILSLTCLFLCLSLSRSFSSLFSSSLPLPTHSFSYMFTRASFSFYFLSHAQVTRAQLRYYKAER